MKYIQLYIIALIAFSVSSCFTNNTLRKTNQELLVGSWEMTAYESIITREEFSNDKPDPDIVYTRHIVGYEHNSLWTFEDDEDYLSGGSVSCDVTTLKEEAGEVDKTSQETDTFYFSHDEEISYSITANRVYFNNQKGNLLQWYDIVSISEDKLELHYDFKTEGKTLDTDYTATGDYTLIFEQL